MRYSMVRLAGALALVVMASILAVIALGLWLWGLYLYSTRYMPQDGAALATGLVTLLLAGAILWAARKLNR